MNPLTLSLFMPLVSVRAELGQAPYPGFDKLSLNGGEMP